MPFFKKDPYSLLILGKEHDVIAAIVSDLEAIPTKRSIYWDKQVLTLSPLGDKLNNELELHLACFDAFIYLIDANDLSEIKIHRQILWETIIWSTFSIGRPLVLFLINSASGLLTKSEIIESLSLVRLTDRVWDIIIGQEADANAQGYMDLIDQLEQFLDVVAPSSDPLKKAYLDNRRDKQSNAEAFN